MDRREYRPWSPAEFYNEKTKTFEIPVDEFDSLIDLAEKYNYENSHICLSGFYDVCPTCNGKGSHVNPSIDSHGISMEEFHEDPSFYEDYRAGVFDVTCYECKGLRVVPILAADTIRNSGDSFCIEALEILYNIMHELDECNRISYCERMRGA